jgi:hypothetical protein
MTDLDQIAAIKSQTLALITELTAHPKPNYRVDGQTVSWSEYLTRLQATVDWCDKQLGAQDPFEIRSQAIT